MDLKGISCRAGVQVFLDLDFTLMEMNPFTLDAAGNPFPLDMRGELDDTAAFKSGKKCARLFWHLFGPVSPPAWSRTRPVHPMSLLACLSIRDAVCRRRRIVTCSHYLLACCSQMTVWIPMLEQHR